MHHNTIKDRCIKIYKVLNKEYGEINCPLYYKTPFQMAVSAMLSAQCTDKRVNETVPILFAKYPNSAAMAKAKISAVEKIIKPVGLYRAKAKNIVNTAIMIEENFSGKIPDTIEKLMELPGIGRKTANVILHHVFNSPGFAVDTHVNRVLNRIGLVKTHDPLKIEMTIRRLLPPEYLGNFSLLLITHGRRVCKARKPNCQQCKINKLCQKLIFQVKN
jgi:endonuclease-3